MATACKHPRCRPVKQGQTAAERMYSGEHMQESVFCPGRHYLGWATLIQLEANALCSLPHAPAAPPRMSL